MASKQTLLGKEEARYVSVLPFGRLQIRTKRRARSCLRDRVFVNSSELNAALVVVGYLNQSYP